MVIVGWIALGLVALLLVLAGVCWLIGLLLDDTDWNRLALRVYRWAKVGLLLCVNVAIYTQVIVAMF